ncbi:immunoglobulin-like domain-containing protein, partial [Arcobacter sp. CECT 8985]|uniref:immunoglobulin-like domain-containing protein n=1 Tax=Arcobacter sp. CECT 8985 TaxID=1935424 RepID=UPI001025ABA6
APEFEKLTVDATKAEIKITDTIDEVKVTVTADGDVKENEAGNFKVNVSQKLDHDLEVTLSDGSKVTIKAGETSVNVPLSAQGDDVWKDGETVELGATSAKALPNTGETSAPEFEKLTVDATKAEIKITDTIDEVKVSLHGIDTNEGEPTVTFIAKLPYEVRAEDPKVVVHTKLGDITIEPKGTVIGKDPDGNDILSDGKTGKIEVSNPNTEDVYRDASTLDNEIISVEGGNFEKLTADTDTVTVKIVDTITPVDISIDAVATAPKVIDVTTVNQEGTGFNTTAYNRDGEEVDVYIKDNPAGLGVEGTAWYTNEYSELGHDERIVFDFTNDVNSLDVSFAWRNNQETAQMTFSNDGKQIGYATVSGGGTDTDAFVRYFDMNNNLLKEVPAQGGSDRIDLAYTFEFPDENGEPMAFDNVEFSAPNPQDDYLIHEISYTEVIDPKIANISTTDGQVTFTFQIDEEYPPQGKATAIVELNGKEYNVDLNATGRGTLTVDAKDFSDLSDIDVKVKEVIGGNYEKVNSASESFDLTGSFIDEFSSTDDSITINEDQTYILSATDFGDYTESVKQFKITEVPSEGTLYLTVHKGETILDANGDTHVVKTDTKVEVNVGQVVSLANVAAGNLVYVPKEDSDNDVKFKFQIGDENGNFNEHEYTTGIEIIAVADAPNASIDVTKVESTSGENNQGGNGNGNSNSDRLDVLQAAHEGTGKDGNLDRNFNYSGTNDIVKDYQNVNASSITTDKGNDTLEFQSLNNGKNINTGDGDDKVVVNQSSSANINLGEGNNTYTVAGSLNQGSTQSGSGDDTFIVNQGTNQTTVNLGDGNNTISVGESLNTSNVSTGSGDDTLIVGNNSDGNTISTGAGDDIVQFNGNVQDTKVDLGDGSDNIYLSSDSDVNFNINTVIDGGKGQDTLHFSGKMEDYKVSVGVDQGEDHLISWDEYAQMNKDPEGYANKEFTIYEVDGNGTLQGSKFVVKNIENVVFESDKDSGTIETTEEYNIDFSASLNDIDGSESLTVTITNVPEGAEFTSTNTSYTLTNNDDGTWTVNLPEGAKNVSDSITMTVPKGTENIDLGITARATETRDNDNGQNYAETTDSDALVYGEDESKTLDFEANTVKSDENIIIVLDVSGSMNDYVRLEDGSWTTRLALAKDALENMIDTYEQYSNVKVNLTKFARTADDLDGDGSDNGWYSPEDALNIINNMSAGGNTNYEDALEETYTNYTPPSNGEKATVYFISDGKPNVENYDGFEEEYGILDSKYLDKWKDFLEDNAKELNVIGIGKGITDSTYLDMVAQNVGNVKTNVTILEDENDLKDKLVENVYEKVEGNVLDNVTGGDESITIDSIEVDGVTHTISESSNNILTLQTSSGGVLEFNFETGDYSFGGLRNNIVEESESFTINVSDVDGDATSFDVNIDITNTVDTVASAPTLSFSIEANGSQEIEHDYNYTRDDYDHSQNFTDADDYINIKDDVDSDLNTSGGNDVVKVGDNVHYGNNINLGDGDDFITIGDSINDYRGLFGYSTAKVDGGEGNDSIYLKGYTVSQYKNNYDNIQDKISNFENIKCSDGVVKGDSSVFNTSPLSSTVYSYTITLAAALVDLDGSETLSKVTVDNIPDTVTSIKDSSGVEYNVTGGVVELPVESGKEEEFTFISNEKLDSTDINSMKASVTSTESESDDTNTVTTTAKLEVDVDESNHMTGTDADEKFDSHGSHATIDAGKGDDEIVFHAGDKVDGGEGEDTLLILDDDESIDISGINTIQASTDLSQVHNIEAIDLSNDIKDNLVIDEEDVKNLTDNENVLKIFGDDSGDRVTLEGGSDNWTSGGQVTDDDGNTFNVFEGTASGTSNIKILIDSDVSVDPDI